MIRVIFIVSVICVFCGTLFAESIDLGELDEGLPDTLDESLDDDLEEAPEKEDDPFGGEPDKKEKEKEEDAFGDTPENTDERFDDSPADDSYAPRDEFEQAPPADEFQQQTTDELQQQPPADSFEQRDGYRDAEMREDSPPPREDVDYLMDRKKELDKYSEPEKGAVTGELLFHKEKSDDSPVMFELYKGDEVEVMYSEGDWYRIRFLGKEGWARKEGVYIPQFHSYRIYFEVNGSMGGVSGDLMNYKNTGVVNARASFSFLQDLSAGVEYQGFFIDSDAMMHGVGGTVRWLVPFLRTKNSRTALTGSGGYMYYLGRPGYTEDFSSYKIFSGGYFSVSLDYIYRLFEWVYIGAGPDILYTSVKTTINNDPIRRDFFYGGGHLKIIVNALR